MPEPLWIYLIVLLYFTKVSSYSTIAEVFPKASHDLFDPHAQRELV
jgi:hypothetical protein